MSGLYIHIPFCRQKCRYCDFASFAGAEQQIDDYLNALEKEASLYAETRFDTLYVGGGTPSLLSVCQLERLVGLIARYFGPLAAFAESTLEANPESASAEKLHLLKEAGFNRLSLGLQSFDDEVLRRIGRIHDASVFLTAYELARKEGFENISADLIAGLPGQTEQNFLAGLKRLVSLKPEHISVYGLQIEPGTPFYQEGVQTDEDLLRRELEQTHFLLEQSGFVHYEISNFSRPGYQSRHNVNYWRNGSYVGLGAAAASYQSGTRRCNVSSVPEYIHRMRRGQSPTDFAETLDAMAKEGEQVMLGLRMREGVRLTARQQQLFARPIQKLISRGLIERKKDIIKLTFERLFLGNQAFMAFLAPFETE